MEDENNKGGSDDIFSGANTIGRGNQVAVETPTAPRTLNLERTISQEEVPMEATPDSMQDITGGYSPEEHRDTLDKVMNQRKDRIKGELNAKDYWKDNDQAIAAAMGIAPGAFMTSIYNALGYVGVNMYKKDAQKAMGKLRGEVNGIQSDINKFESRLEGKVKYNTRKEGESPDESLRRLKRVRQTDKGVKYKLTEETDEARRLGYQYRNGLRALNDYRQKIGQVEEDIGTLQSSNDPTASVKINNLQTEKGRLLNEKEEVQQRQRVYEQELIGYEKRIDRLQSKSSFYDIIIRKGNSKISQIDSAIDILDDYIRERDDLVSVNDLLNDLKALDQKHERIEQVRVIYDGIVGDGLEELKDVVERNDIEYSNRPLMQQVGQMSKESQIANEKKMGQVLGKLGIQI